MKKFGCPYWGKHTAPAQFPNLADREIRRLEKLLKDPTLRKAQREFFEKQLLELIAFSGLKTEE